jgi:PKHD-type hydroxylase
MWHLRKDTIERWCWAQPLTKEGCEKVIELGNQLEPKDSLIEPVITDKDIISQTRKNKSCMLPINDDTRWIFETCSKIIIDMNKQFFEYDLDYIGGLQFTVYNGETQDFYNKHIDTLYESAGIRKLSFSIQLSEPDSYEGGELQLHYSSSPDIAKKDQGSMTIFPSFSLHEVTPVTKGTRYSLVGWVVGPKLK